MIGVKRRWDGFGRSCWEWTLWLLLALVAGRSVGLWGESAFVERQRFRSSDAHQGVGVDGRRVYAVGSRSITAHDKWTGQPVARWKAPPLGPWIHLDSAVVLEGKIYCAHSNYPFLPMTGSVEVFDAASLKWLSRHTFVDPPGSCTWVDWANGHWWACFAHYNGPGGEPDKDHSWTTLVQFSPDWQELKRWRFPKAVLSRFGDFSCSGGSFGADGLLYCTGHDEAEVYAMRIPEGGGELEFVSVFPLTCFGQGIAWDRSGTPPFLLYSIKRATKEVIASALRRE